MLQFCQKVQEQYVVCAPVRLCVCAMPENAGNCGVLRQNFAQQRLCEIRFCCATWSRLKKHLEISAAIKIGVAG